MRTEKIIPKEIRHILRDKDINPRNWRYINQSVKIICVSHKGERKVFKK